MHYEHNAHAHNRKHHEPEKEGIRFCALLPRLSVDNPLMSNLFHIVPWPFLCSKENQPLAKATRTNNQPIRPTGGEVGLKGEMPPPVAKKRHAA